MVVPTGRAHILHIRLLYPASSLCASPAPEPAPVEPSQTTAASLACLGWPALGLFLSSFPSFLATSSEAEKEPSPPSLLLPGTTSDHLVDDSNLHSNLWEDGLPWPFPFPAVDTELVPSWDHWSRGPCVTWTLFGTTRLGFGDGWPPSRG